MIVQVPSINLCPRTKEERPCDDRNQLQNMRSLLLVASIASVASLNGNACQVVRQPHFALRRLRARAVVASDGGNRMPWKEITDRPDNLPCFVIVDEKRMPPPGMESAYNIYVDAEQAQAELLEAQSKFPDIGLRLLSSASALRWSGPLLVSLRPLRT